MATKYGMYENIVPLLAPVDIAANATATPMVDLKTAHDVTFLVSFGVLTSASASVTAGPTVTVMCSSGSATTGGTAIDFNYRLSAAVGTNTWGAVTSCASTGYVADIGGDGKALLIQVDPAAVQADHDLARYVWVKLTPDAEDTVTLCGVIAFVSPIYKATTMITTST